MTATRTLVVGVGPSGTALSVPAFELSAASGTFKRVTRAFQDVRRIRIGHSGTCELCLADESVSGVHCELVAEMEGIRLRDLRSKNGVWLGGARVSEAWLEDGATFQVGRTRVRFRFVEAGEPRLLGERAGFGGLLGQSWVMRELYAAMDVAARAEFSIVFEGETGSGKDTAFEALVEAGDRKKGPIEVVDCAALSPSLAEAELFGHESGAFTGATSSRAGAFERAHGGSLLLDHVSELSRELQPRLLGALERRSVQRLGGNRRIPFDVRLYSSTQRPLEVEVNQGRFRADLFYRLAGITLRIPPLRERPEDIPLLVSHFLEQMPGAQPLGPDLLAQLSHSAWPGNVRELRSRVELAALNLTVDSDGSARDADSAQGTLPFRQQKERAVQVFETAYLSALLRETSDNITEASRRSGLSRVHLYELLRKYGLRPPRP